MAAENTITITNSTANNNKLKVAIFQKSEQPTSKEVVAWRVVSPAAGGGKGFVQVPDDYAIAVKLEDNSVSYITNQCGFSSYSANLTLNAIEDDQSGQRTFSLSLDASGTQADPNNHVTVEIPRQVAKEVKVELLKDGDLILPSVATKPGEMADFVIVPTFYLAVVEQDTKPGELLSARTISDTLTPIRPGQMATITEDNQGYHMSIN